MNAKETFENNQKGHEESFIGLLHEAGTFSMTELRNLLQAIATILHVFVSDPSKEEDFLVFAKDFNKVSGHILRCCFSHLNRNDIYEMQNPPSSFYFLLDRLNIFMISAIEKDTTLIREYFDEYGSFSEFEVPEPNPT